MKKLFQLIGCFIFVLVSINLNSQILDLESTSDGILIPRMTEAQRDDISPDIEGMLIYQTDNTKGFYYYSGSSWTPLAGSGSSGSIILGGKVFGNFTGPRYSIGSAACVPDQELHCSMVVPRGGTLKNLFVLPSGVTPMTSTSTFTVRIDGENTSLSTSVAGGTSAVASDLVNTVNISQGQRLTVETNVTGVSSGVSFFISMLFE